MLVLHNTIRALRRLSWYIGVLKEIWGRCAGTEEYHRSTAEDVLVQQSTIGLLGRLCGYTRVLKGGCAGTAEYYRNTREAF